MATKALLDVLEQTIGKYVRNLDAQSLNVAVWSGKIELQNLELDCDAVNAALDRQAAEAPNLAVPLRVVNGRFQSLQVDVPWRRITSDPVVMRAHGLYVTVEPYDRTAAADFLQAVHDNEEVRAKNIRNARQDQVHAAEEYRSRTNALVHLADGERASFGTRLVRRIVENLQVEISNVHIELKGAGCEAGVVLESLELQTTDASGTPSFVDRSKSKSSFLFKSLRINGLGFYIDEDNPVHLASIDENDETDSPDHTYILAPLSLEAKLRQADSDICTEFPRYTLSSELDCLSILLSRSQLQLIRSIQAQVKPSNAISIPLFPEYRPLQRISAKTTKLWWKYAVRCVGRLNGQRSWVEFWLAFRTRQRYVPLYKRFAHAEACPWIKELSEIEKRALVAIEEDRSISVDGIMQWRDLADSQVKLEKIKHTEASTSKRSGLLTSIFGTTSTDEELDDVTPVLLSSAELKELQAVELASNDDELNEDSKLCNVSFSLGAMKIQLTRDCRPLVALDMGTVRTALHANSNGAFDFSFSLTSLEIEDKHTVDTMFPTILRNQDGALSTNAFHIDLIKAQNGDQQLVAKLCTFEAVASPDLLQALQQFFASSPIVREDLVDPPNAMLRQSMSGSVDLFYDAFDAGSGTLSSPTMKNVKEPAAPSAVTETLIEAWKTKTSTKANWSVDLDLSAPIGVVPESSTSPFGNVLVFDLGHFRLRYGTTPSNQVEEWFNSNPVDGAVHSREYGSLTADNLMFMIGKAKYWKRLVEKERDLVLGELDDSAVIQPTTVEICFGVESSLERLPRVPLFCTVPSIDIAFSAFQVTRLSKVVDKWLALVDSGSGVESEQVTSELVLNPSIADINALDSMDMLIPVIDDATGTGDQALYFTQFDLNSCSLKCLTESGDGLEANLTAVRLSYELHSDRSSTVNVSMGHFWMLDNISVDFTRRQRLIAYSSLPSPVIATLNDGGKIPQSNDIPWGKELPSERSGLVEASIRSSSSRFGEGNLWDSSDLTGQDYAVEVVVDIQFKTLHMNWNPQAIKMLVGVMDKFAGAWDHDHSTVIVDKARERALSMASHGENSVENHESKVNRALILRVAFEGLVLSLQSAHDDCPLFVFTLWQAGIRSAFDADKRKVLIDVGDLRVETSSTGRRDSSYTCILGLSPGATSQMLLKVEFREGLEVEDPNLTQVTVVLSPVRLVYLQAQIMALVEYSTEGILGALTAQVAASTVAVAVEYAASSIGRMVVQVDATEALIVVPTAAYELEWLSISSGDMHLKYESSQKAGHATVDAVVSRFIISDSSSVALQRQPIELKLTVDMPPEDVGTMDDQAMKVDLNLHKAAFIISRDQYKKLLAILDTNLGDEDMHLRANYTAGGRTWKDDDEKSVVQSITHAGNAVVVKLRRTFLNVNIGSLSLELFLANEEPLIHLTGADAEVSLKLLSDTGETKSTVSLKQLECKDTRLVSIGRQYRSLVFQPDVVEEEAGSSLFSIQYDSDPDGSNRTKVMVGSPCFVFIPDALASILDFVANDHSKVEPSKESLSIQEPKTHNQSQHFLPVTNLDTSLESGVEAIYSDKRPAATTTTAFDFSTAQCSIIFVDLGSDAIMMSTGPSSSAEVIVMDGAFTGNVRVTNDASTGQTNRMDSQLEVDSLEVYTAFGAGRESPLQILDPTRFSFFYSSKVEGKASEVTVRAAAVEPIEICVSMRNIALMNAIASTLADTFDTDRSAVETESKQGNIEETPIAASSVRLTLPTTVITFVNDLQGLDEALVRMTARNFVMRSQTQLERTTKAVPFTSFDFSIHTSILSDFFDSSSIEWRAFLQKPWELSMTGKRSTEERFGSERPSSTFDVESFPCSLSISELFLMNLASASRMWSIYSTATQHDLNQESRNHSSRERRSIAASAARTFVSSLPYAVENHSGIEFQFGLGDSTEYRVCRNGLMEFFRFEPPSIKGKGGKRLYGQDVLSSKQFCILEDGRVLFSWQNIDDAVGADPQVFRSRTGALSVANIARERKTTVCHLSSGVDIENSSTLSFDVSSSASSKGNFTGRCFPSENLTTQKKNLGKSLVTQDGHISKQTKRFALPADCVQDFYTGWGEHGEAEFSFVISPVLKDVSCRLLGSVRVKLATKMFKEDKTLPERVENIVCIKTDTDHSHANDASYPFAVQMRLNAVLCRGYPVVRMSLQPRAIFENNLPISIIVKTPMPHTYSSNASAGDETHHELDPERNIEVFTPGPSVAISISCRDLPVGGTPTGWMSIGWIDLPLVREFQIPEPIECEFPVSSKTVHGTPILSGGPSFVISEGRDGLGVFSDNGKPPPRRSFEPQNSPKEGNVELTLAENTSSPRTFLATTHSYAVDHTGEVLFEDAEPQVTAPTATTARPAVVPFGAYRSQRHHGRISLLAGQDTRIRLLHLTMEGDEGVRRSGPFLAEEVAICEGGVDATPLAWEDGRATGLFAYRRLISPYQFELHVIPEYVVYNGSTTQTVVVRQPGGTDISIPPGKISALQTHSQETAVLTVGFASVNGRTSPVRVDNLGLRVASVKDREGSPIGSVAIQTVVGAQDSKLVVKLGDLRLAAAYPENQVAETDGGILANDHFRFRVQWTELRLALFEARVITRPDQAIFESALDRIKKAATPTNQKTRPSLGSPNTKSSKSGTWVSGRQESSPTKTSENLQNPVCTLLFSRFTVDWQRVFKSEDSTNTSAFSSPERSQLSIIVHHVQVRDETPGTPYPIVLDSTSDISFLDLCVRGRGSVDSNHINVDLFDLNLAHANGQSQKIVINTDESFVWKLLDLADRILEAAGEFAGFEIKLTWDEENESYSVSFEEPRTSFIDAEANYQPPKSDTILHVKKIRVSPFSVLVSFKRKPEASRYKIRKGVRGANAMNYFSRKLKFKIEKAELKFARYEAASIDGPPDRFIEILSTVYMSRVKMKLVTILSAATFQDWKTLASRDGGDDEFVDGDILRATGNIAGRTANLLLRGVGTGIGSGVSNITSTIGDGFEHATTAIGANRVGVGVNSFVSGVGDGVGDTISGVGTGAGKLLKGTGQGLGMVAGGVSGGAIMIGKGIGKGITRGDGKAVATGFVDGATSIGTGVGRGVESVVLGAAGGVASIGQGLFSGVQNVGRGIGGAFTGKKSPRKLQGGKS